MASTFNVRVFDPTGLKLEVVAHEARLQTIDGQIGILPHHTKYAGVLASGPLLVMPKNGDLQRLMVSGGLVSFENDTLTVLGDTVS